MVSRGKSTKFKIIVGTYGCHWVGKSICHAQKVTVVCYS